MATIFTTPGHIPLDAFTQFAVHHKPKTDNPIGHFGTGLKYAVAIILRNGGKFRMWVGGVEYEFYTHDTEFRGQSIETIRMRKKNGLGKWLKSFKLPFTTDLGKNWGLWQAYRELLSNTLDEKGYAAKGTDPSSYAGDRNTVIVVECEGFDEAQDGVYLPHDLQDYGHSFEAPDVISERVDVWHRPSKYIYFKGIRVHELPIPSYFTYNFKSGITLSEDRSIMNQYDALAEVAKVLDTMDIDTLMSLFDDEETRWFEAHELSYYNLINTRGSMRTVAERIKPGMGGYYVRSLVSSLAPSEPSKWNFDEWFDFNEIYEFVTQPPEETKVFERFIQFVLDEGSLIDKIRSHAEGIGDDLPEDLQP